MFVLQIVAQSYAVTRCMARVEVSSRPALSDRTRTRQDAFIREPAGETPARSSDRAASAPGSVILLLRCASAIERAGRRGAVIVRGTGVPEYLVAGHGRSRGRGRDRGHGVGQVTVSNVVTSRDSALISTPIRCTVRPGAWYLSA